MIDTRYNVRHLPLDPVNIVFRGHLVDDDLCKAILEVLDDNGWEAAMQSHEYLLEFDLTFRTERFWRTLGGHAKRFHVRFWKGDLGVLGSAHLENFKLWPFGHNVSSFDDGKRIVEEVFDAAGWHVGRDEITTSYPIEKPACNGKASLIVQV